MSWLDTLSKQARDAMVPAAKSGRPAAKPKRKPQVHLVTVTVNPPSGDSAGEIAEGYYTEVDGVLTMTDEKGHPLAKSTESNMHVLAPGDNARSIAGVLLRKSLATSGFNRQLFYSPGSAV